MTFLLLLCLVCVCVCVNALAHFKYKDSLEFQSKGGSFRVCLNATVPHHDLEVPESVLLPACAVEHSSNATFLLRNRRYDSKYTKVGIIRDAYLWVKKNISNCYSFLFFFPSHDVCMHSKLQTFFQWECQPPFQLSPERGLLKPRQNCCITVVFHPQAGLVHQELAHCWFGEENNDTKSSCTVLLRGEGMVASALITLHHFSPIVSLPTGFCCPPLNRLLGDPESK